VHVIIQERNANEEPVNFIAVFLLLLKLPDRIPVLNIAIVGVYERSVVSAQHAIDGGAATSKISTCRYKYLDLDMSYLDLDIYM